MSHDNHNFKMYVNDLETALPEGLYIDATIDYQIINMLLMK